MTLCAPAGWQAVWMTAHALLHGGRHRHDRLDPFRGVQNMTFRAPVTADGMQLRAGERCVRLRDHERFAVDPRIPGFVAGVAAADLGHVDAPRVRSSLIVVAVALGAVGGARPDADVLAAAVEPRHGRVAGRAIHHRAVRRSLVRNSEVRRVIELVDLAAYAVLDGVGIHLDTGVALGAGTHVEGEPLEQRIAGRRVVRPGEADLRGPASSPSLRMARETLLGGGIGSQVRRVLESSAQQARGRLGHRTLMAVAAVTVLRNAQARVLLGRHEEAHLTDLESVDGGDGAILGEVFGAEAVAVGAVVLPEARFLVPGSLVVVASAVARHTAIEAHALVHEQERRDHVVDDSLLMLVAGEAVLVLDVRVPGGEERHHSASSPSGIRMGEREGGQRGAVVQVGSIATESSVR